jgi:peptidoglycan/xylan/chitin deacetylase (PgdA/CDA1 family)
MRYIHEKTYKALSLRELIDPVGYNHQKGIVITFDDGFANNHTNALPILKAFGLTATIFIITDCVGKHKYMDLHQLKEIEESGVSVQSHTVSHRPLTMLARHKILYELEGSKKWIEDHLSNSVDFLSAPHGMIDRRVLDVARSVGYRAVCTAEPSFSHSYGDPAVLNRINISDRCHMSTFQRLVEANRIAILPLKLSKILKNFAKKGLGWGNYRRIYRLGYRIGE